MGWGGASLVLCLLCVMSILFLPEQEMGYGYVKNSRGKITTEWLQEGTYEIGKH
jgi:hypothetical protein